MRSKSVFYENLAFWLFLRKSPLMFLDLLSRLARCRGRAQKVDFKRSYWRCYSCTRLPFAGVAQHLGGRSDGCLDATQHVVRLHRQHHSRQQPEHQQKIRRRQRRASRSPATIARRTMPDIGFKVIYRPLPFPAKP